MCVGLLSLAAQFTHSVSVPLAAIHSVKHLPAGVLDKFDLKIPDGILVLCKNFDSLRVRRLEWDRGERGEEGEGGYLTSLVEEQESM